MSLKFFSFVSLAILVSFTMALPYHKADIATTLGKSADFEVEPKEEKRAPCTDRRGDHYCFIEAVYADACTYSQADMTKDCAQTCGFC